MSGCHAVYAPPPLSPVTILAAFNCMLSILLTRHSGMLSHIMSVYHKNGLTNERYSFCKDFLSTAQQGAGI